MLANDNNKKVCAQYVHVLRFKSVVAIWMQNPWLWRTDYLAQFGNEEIHKTWINSITALLSGILQALSLHSL